MASRFKVWIYISHYTFSNKASRLGREHHDDLAQFMLGMGYANEGMINIIISYEI